MNKQEFFNDLAARLAPLPQIEIDKSIAYYNEMLDDRVEDGMTEEEAVSALGDVRVLTESVMCDQSIPALVKARVSESKDRAASKGLWLVLAIAGFPLWFPLLAALAAVVIALYVSIWSVIISFYAVVLSLGVACFAGLLAGFARGFVTSMPLGLCIIGMAVVCGALCLFLIKPVYLITKRLLRFTTDSMRRIKSLFITRKAVA